MSSGFFASLVSAGMTPSCFCLFKDPLANHIPARIEAALLFLDVRLWNMVRRMDGSGSKIDEEGFFRRQRLLEANPFDGLRGHVIHEVIVGVVGRLDAVLVVVDGGRPLIRLAAQESVELVEAL